VFRDRALGRSAFRQLKVGTYTCTLVAQVGHEIIRGRKCSCGPLTLDWVHFIFGLLYHDIAFARGA
jgi:hypothetical protein